MAEEKTVHLNFDDHEAPGLYLIFDDGTRIALTRENVEQITEDYWKDSSKIPAEVKNAVAFKRCDFCPLKGDHHICDALRPILPLLETLDKHNSFDEVTAVYKWDDHGLYHVSHTTMQRALRYISNLSLMEYCRTGIKFHKYFNGTIPISGTDEMVNRIYLNIYWIHQGDQETIDRVINELKKDMTMAVENQVRRLRLISKNDAFLNAFVLTHMITEVLHENRDRKLKEQLKKSD